jgi:hypothetical protein
MFQVVLNPYGGFGLHPIGTMTLSKEEIDDFIYWSKEINGVISSDKQYDNRGALSFEIIVKSKNDIPSVIEALTQSLKVICSCSDYYYKGVLIKLNAIDKN